MRVTYQADADLDGRILRGLRRAAPEIDIRTATAAHLESKTNEEVLRIAADTGRILVSQDRRTMPGHFNRFVKSSESPGVILLREAVPISSAIEELILIWSASDARDLAVGQFGRRVPNRVGIIARLKPVRNRLRI